MPIIIIDHLRKRKYHDTDWSDPFSLNEIHKEKARTLEIEKTSDNPVDKFILKYGDHKCLLGKKVWSTKDKSDKILTGGVVDVLVTRMLLLKKDGKVFPVRFRNVFSVEE